MKTSSLAIITGASSGIGEALAHEFGRHGHDLVLVARDESRLLRVAAELQSQFSCQAHTVVQDLTLPSAPAALYAAVSDLGRSASVLVNNAGFGVHGAFSSNRLDDELALVDLQISALLRLTKLFLPSMVAQGDGRILNLASLYSYCAVPFQAVYGASKAFMLHFSHALAVELEGSGVSVTSVCPGSVRTEFRRRAHVAERRPQAGMAPEAVASLAYKGMMQRKPVVIPGSANQLFAALTCALPNRAGAKLLRHINRFRGVGKALGSDNVIG